MTDLEDASALERADSAGLLRALAGAGAQVRRAADLAAECGLDQLADARPRGVLCLGVGTAGLVGDLLAVVAGPGCPVPVLTHQGFGLPGWVGTNDVVVAVGYSADEQEPGSGVQEAVRRGSRILAVGAAGSPLQALAERGHGCFVPVPRVGPARMALWALAVPVLLAGRSMGLLALDSADLAAAAARLDQLAVSCRVGSESFVNPAKELALELAGRLPILWGSSPLTGFAARRLAAQLAANAKTPALAGVLPAAGHGQLALLDGPAAAGPVRSLFDDPVAAGTASGGAGPAGLRLVLLREAAQAEDPQLAWQAEVCRALAEDRRLPVTELVAGGSGPLERLASLVGLTDWASVYLALLTDQDPAVVPAVDSLQEQVAAAPR